MKKMLLILTHDLHKLKIQGYKTHIEALNEFSMKKADGIASWFSRNGSKEQFNKNNRLYVRDSYILNINKNQIKNQIHQKKGEIFKIFEEKNPLKLHSLILKSKILNKFSESVTFPYTSYKYHLLLTSSFFWNLENENDWSKLYLGENTEVESPFQIIYKDKDREWALLPAGGLSRVSPKFSETWMRRTELSIGGENQVLDGLLSRIGSWSAALATIEDWVESG